MSRGNPFTQTSQSELCSLCEGHSRFITQKRTYSARVTVFAVTQASRAGKPNGQGKLQGQKRVKRYGKNCASAKIFQIDIELQQNGGKLSS